MTARTRTTSNTDAALEAMAEELISAEVKLAKVAGDVVARIEEIKAEMRKVCPKGGKYKWTFPNKGEVELAGAADAKFKGMVPEVTIATWLALPEKRREKLKTEGIVADAAVYGKPFYGRVSPKLFS